MQNESIGSPDREQGLAFLEDRLQFAGQQKGAKVIVQECSLWRDGLGLSYQDKKLNCAASYPNAKWAPDEADPQNQL